MAASRSSGSTNLLRRHLAALFLPFNMATAEQMDALLEGLSAEDLEMDYNPDEPDEADVKGDEGGADVDLGFDGEPNRLYSARLVLTHRLRSILLSRRRPFRNPLRRLLHRSTSKTPPSFLGGLRQGPQDL